MVSQEGFRGGDPRIRGLGEQRRARCGRSTTVSVSFCWAVLSNNHRNLVAVVTKVCPWLTVPAAGDARPHTLFIPGSRRRIRKGSTVFVFDAGEKHVEAGGSMKRL